MSRRGRKPESTGNKPPKLLETQDDSAGENAGKSETAGKPKTANIVIGQKRVRKNYPLGDDYKAWKAECDKLKSSAVYHGSEATRFRNEWKKVYENGAEGFCAARDEKEWHKVNNLITIAEMKASDRANAWKPLPVNGLDLPNGIVAALTEHGFATVEKVSEWFNKAFRGKIKGISKASAVKIGDALTKFIAPYHAEILNEEVERARAKREALAK